MPEAVPNQKLLNNTQLTAFYVDIFVETQIRQFLEFTADLLPVGKTVVDIGGGCGHFAHAVHTSGVSRARVIDMDRTAIARCRQLHADIEAIHGDGLTPPQMGDEGIVCFNLVLHHLVGENEKATRKLQKQALLNWRGKADYLFVNEYIYESPADLSGRLIYEITSSPVLSSFAKVVSRFIPSLRANTFDVGVRFRSNQEWVQLFDECGFEVVRNERSHYDRVSAPQRLLMIRTISIDSFLLRAK